jgi:hypothetical protein
VDSPVEGERADAVVGRARVVVTLTALWVWSLVVVLPSIEQGVGSALAVGLALVFPAVVGAGLALDVLVSARPGRSSPRRRQTALLLLGLAPPALVGPLAVRADLVAADLLGPLHLTASVVAAAAYFGAVSWLLYVHEPRRPAHAQALPPASLAHAPPWPRLARRALVGLASFGAVGLVAVAPGWGGHALRVARHGPEGAEAAATLAAVVGLAAGVMLLGGSVGPALRARAATSPILPTRGRTSAWLGLALLALLAWWLLVRA